MPVLTRYQRNLKCKTCNLKIESKEVRCADCCEPVCSNSCLTRKYCSNCNNNYYDVERIIDMYIERGSRYFLILWDDGSETWESEEDCDRCQYSLSQFLKSRGLSSNVNPSVTSDAGVPHENTIKIDTSAIKIDNGQIDKKPDIEFINIDDWSDFEE